MKKIDPKGEGATTDIVERNIEKLRELFPDAFTEGSDEDLSAGAQAGGPRWKVDFDALREILGNYVEDSEERYSFTWNGKARTRRIAQTPSTGTLRPCPEESVNWKTTKNLFIEGDNLEVLKLLQKSYHKKVKMIYIDPPYNTGKDFIYPDDFRDNIKNYLELTGQTDGEGRRLSTNAETSGRYHTDWLNMMYPRLKLVRNLLLDDGVICVSIDDHEVHDLRMIMNEVFGEENFVGCCVWERKRKGSHLSQKFTQKTEYLIIYGRGIDVRLFGEPAGAEEDQPLIKRTNALKELIIPAGTTETPMPDQVFQPGRYGNGSSAVELLEETEISKGRFVREVKLRGPFIWTQTNLDEELAAGARVFIRTSNFSLRVLKALERQGFKALSSLLTQEVGTNEDASKELADLLGLPEDQGLFDYPKPSSYIAKLVRAATYWDKSAVILDFFAGSATTAHAVLNLNKEDGGNRKFIMVQLPESCDEKSRAFKAGYKTIADIGKERIRRVIKKLSADYADERRKADEGLFENNLRKSASSADSPDLGFKVFKLDTSNIIPWDADFDNLEAALFNAVENIKPDRNEADVLYELLLKYGLDLAVPIEERKIDGKIVYIIGAGALVVCLADKISLDVVEGIAALKDELKPEVMRVVFKDSGFADDVVKTNAVQILRQAGIEDVKSL